MKTPKDQDARRPLQRFVGRIPDPLLRAILWLLKWPVLYDLQIVCVINMLSLLYINLLPHDPLHLAPTKSYLLPINAYAFGTVLMQIFKKPRRHDLGGDGQGDAHGDKHRDGCSPVGIVLAPDGTPHGDTRRG